MTGPFVSVVSPVYDGERYSRKASGMSFCSVLGCW